MLQRTAVAAYRRNGLRGRISGSGLHLYGSISWIGRYRSCALIRGRIGSRLHRCLLYSIVIVRVVVFDSRPACEKLNSFAAESLIFVGN